MNDDVWTFADLAKGCDGHYCMADGKDYPALCRYEENMTGHPLGDVCGADCMGECSERFCPSEEVRRLIGNADAHREAKNITRVKDTRLEGEAKC